MSYTVLINTCDKFEDCWNPFFKLWSIYWPDCNGKLYLNTEYKNYSFTGLNIRTVKGCHKNNIPKTKRATWSQCLKWALESIEDDIVLYMQEDYFLKDKVKNSLVDYYVNLMHENTKIKCIHLTDQSVSSDGKSEFKNLNKVKLHQRYRVSCQAALWRKTELVALLRDYENAWEFEEFGSARSAIMKKNYYAVSREFVKIDQFEIIPYIFTGIVQGRWYDPIVELFDRHSIEIDYGIRGFVSDAPQKPFKNRVKYRLNKIPKIIRHQLDLIKVKADTQLLNAPTNRENL
ncbi:hypothetical protein [Mangrovibacterium sp.]|uniref:hypothetical protein n=1 Tax=Mangrovibacterium sp. TaxID=1961364 RepID=UPI0035682A35